MNVNRTIDIKPGELRCPRCFAKDVVMSMPRGVLDAIMKKCGRVPRHCRACGKRFYVATEFLRKRAVQAESKV